jgi:transcriptional regulator with XRE-family HTH domain
VALSLSDDDANEAERLMKERFGINLRAARTALGLTQEQLGESSQHGRVYVQRIETGQINVSLATMVSLARGVRRTVVDLLQPPGDVDRTPPIENTVGDQVAIHPGDLAIELPAGTAFEAGQVLARHLGKSVPLIDPATRTVSGIAGIAPPGRATRETKK